MERSRHQSRHQRLVKALKSHSTADLKEFEVIFVAYAARRTTGTRIIMIAVKDMPWLDMINRVMKCNDKDAEKNLYQKLSLEIRYCID